MSDIIKKYPKKRTKPHLSTLCACLQELLLDNNKTILTIFHAVNTQIEKYFLQLLQLKKNKIICGNNPEWVHILNFVYKRGDKYALRGINDPDTSYSQPTVEIVFPNEKDWQALPYKREKKKDEK